MDFVNDVIARKRDGGALNAEHIRAFVRGATDGSVPSYQVSALLMAIVWRGLDDDETVELARAIVESGKTLDLSALRRPVLDKHSSGGVGDKVTLVLAPLIAACGAIFGKMSGRGLATRGARSTSSSRSRASACSFPRASSCVNSSASASAS